MTGPPPRRFRKGQRVEHYDGYYERFGTPWRPGVVIDSRWSFPAKDGRTVWALVVADLLPDGTPSATRYAITLDPDGRPHNGTVRPLTHQEDRP